MTKNIFLIRLKIKDAFHTECRRSVGIQFSTERYSLTGITIIFLFIAPQIFFDLFF